MQNKNMIRAQEPEPLFSCCVQDCASEVSFYAKMLKVSDKGPICVECWEDQSWNESAEPDCDSWYDLPPFIPAYQAEIDALKAKCEELNIEVQVLRKANAVASIPAEDRELFG